MLSADPIINSIYNTQAYNRFSYVWNNPLKFVDPDGYDGRFVQWIKNLFSNKQTDCYSFGDIKVNDRNHRGEAGRNGNFGKAFGGWLKGFFGTGEGGVSLHQANGYNAPRSIAITGFAMNQSSFNFGGSYFSSESYDPLDDALAQGPPGEGGNTDGAASILAGGWTISLAEPTPYGELVMGVCNSSSNKLLWARYC
jgi:hypothetical protein